MLSAAKKSSLIRLFMLCLLSVATVCASEVVSEKQLHAPGWHEVQFSTLAPFSLKSAEEKYQIYWPRAAALGKPCGILAWTSPLDKGGLPHRFQPLFEKWDLIAICAYRAGNDQKTARRINLLTAAVARLGSVQTIRPDRCVTAGLSGGGRISAIAAFLYPQLWSGAVSWCGSQFYKDYRLASGDYRSGMTGKMSAAELAAVKKQVRFAILTGSNDFNLEDSRAIAAVMKREKFQVRLREIPGLGHEIGSVQEMDDALAYVFGAAK